MDHSTAIALGMGEIIGACIAMDHSIAIAQSVDEFIKINILDHFHFEFI